MNKIEIKGEMNNEQLKEEFSRWIDSNRPRVYYRQKDYKTWFVTNFPNWENDIVYIVEDDQASLRKLQIDKPDTIFQEFCFTVADWVDLPQDNKWTWYHHGTYRIKPIKDNYKFLVKETYKKIYDRHYKFLTKNHMAEDRSERLATIFAIQNTWREYNKENKCKSKN